MPGVNHGRYVDARDAEHCKDPACRADSHSIDFMAEAVTVRVKAAKGGGVQLVVYLGSAREPVLCVEGLQLAPRGG